MKNLRLIKIPDLAEPKVRPNFRIVSNAEIHHWSCLYSMVRDQTKGMTGL